jgi:hypothetical protein
MSFSAFFRAAFNTTLSWNRSSGRACSRHFTARAKQIDFLNARTVADAAREMAGGNRHG